MPAALKRPTLDELYKCLRDLDYTQIDERMAVMLNAILQLEAQWGCRESAIEAVLMVGYTTEGISNQEQTRWLSWKVDGGVRGFDLARNPGLSNNTEYGAGEFPLPARPPAGLAAQSTSRPSSMIRSQQTEEAYPDLSSLKRELERAQRERDKANLDKDGAKLERDQANLERDQAVLERDQAWSDLSMLRAEYLQGQRVRENEANCEQLKSEMETLQRRQRELERQKEKRTRTREPAAAASRPESRMQVDEAPRSSGRLNLDRAAQEHMNEGLEMWIPPEPLPSVNSLDAQLVRPLMKAKLPGYTSSSTTSSSQAGSGSSCLKALQERLQSRSRDDSVKEGRPPTWRDHPVRSATIASYKKNNDGAYHRHNRMDWTAAQRARRDCFHDAAWAEYFTQPRIPDGAVHLIIGDSLIRVLTRIQSHWQAGVLSFSGAATPQMLASLEMLDMVKMYTVYLMMATNDVSRGESRKVMRLHEKMNCILQELRIWFNPAIFTICTVPYNMMFDQHAMEMNEKVRNFNGEIRQIQQRSVLPVRLLDVADLMEESLPRDASSDGIRFDTPKGAKWLNGVFQRHINQLESDLMEMV